MRPELETVSAADLVALVARGMDPAVGELRITSELPAAEQISNSSPLVNSLLLSTAWTVPPMLSAPELTEAMPSSTSMWSRIGRGA
jgi:hypothetical protein